MPRPQTALRRYALLLTLPLLVITLTSTLWAMALLSAVPNPMAVHFDAAGNADGFSSPTGNLVLINGICLAMTLGLGSMAVRGVLQATSGRILAATGGMIVTLVAIIQLVLYRRQAGLAEATAATLPLTVLGVSLGIALLVWLLLGAMRPPNLEHSPPGGAPLATDAQQQVPKDAVWQSVQPMHFTVRLILCLVSGMTLGMTLLVPGWLSIPVTGIMILALLATWDWRLRVDERGFHYRSLLGFPRGAIRYGDIAEVDLVEIQPGAWGGWGWRKTGAGTGLIAGSGPGLRITQHNGKILEASAHDAAGAIQALNYYLDDQPAGPQSDTTKN